MILKGPSSLLVIALGYQVVFASELESDLIGCARVSDETQRLFCYDAVAQRLLDSQSADQNQSKPASLPSLKVANERKSEDVGENSAGMPTDLGGKHFDNSVEGKTKRAALLVHGKVISCKKSATGKWVFIFEGDQIWRQVDSSRRAYRSCEFGVTISKDKIGFKLRVDGEARSMRVRRMR